MSEREHWTLAQRGEYVLARILQCLPGSWTSAIGAMLGAFAARRAIRSRRKWVDRLHENFRHYRGENDAEERRRRIIEFIAGVGRVHAEFMVQQKIVADGRLEIIGKEHLPPPGQQVIIVSSHLANWELAYSVLPSLGRPFCLLYLPLKNPVKRKLALEARKRWKGDNEFVPTEAGALRRIDRAIERGLNVLMFIDEEKNGCIRAPALGRTIPYAGNRWFAARLAVRHGLDVLPVHIERTGAARYRAVFSPRLRADEGCADDTDRAQKLADVLDSLQEGWIRSALEDWYWLPYFDRNITQPRDAGS